MDRDWKRPALMFAIYAVVIYVIWETLDALRTQERRTKIVAPVLFFLIGFAIGGYWMYKHLTCPDCQRRWNAVKRKMGMKLIEEAGS